MEDLDAAQLLKRLRRLRVDSIGGDVFFFHLKGSGAGKEPNKPRQPQISSGANMHPPRRMESRKPPISDNAAYVESTLQVAIRPCTRPKNKQPRVLNPKSNMKHKEPRLKVSTFPKTKVATKKYLKNPKRNKKPEKTGYFSGTYIEEREAPIPGVPCRTGLLVIANSPR